MAISFNQANQAALMQQQMQDFQQAQAIMAGAPASLVLQQGGGNNFSLAGQAALLQQQGNQPTENLQGFQMPNLANQAALMQQQMMHLQAQQQMQQMQQMQQQFTAMSMAQQSQMFSGIMSSVQQMNMGWANFLGGPSVFSGF